MQDDTITHSPNQEHDKLRKSRFNPWSRVPESWRGLLSFIAIIACAFIIANMLTDFVFQSYEVEGASMANTLHDKDRLIVLKTGKTWSEVTHKSFIPKRGDIVIFNRPADAGIISNDKQLIKRVIGLPGERVVVKDGLLTVYNAQSPNGFEPDQNANYQILGGYTSGDVDVTIPAGQVFVCGDNRENSYDSRNFGPVDTKQIVGSLSLRVYPFSQFDRF